MPYQQPSYDEIKCRYEKLRRMSRAIALENLPPTLTGKRNIAICKSEISLKGITLECLHQLKRWQTSGSRRVVWDWKDVIQTYRPKPKRFELSIWHRDINLGDAAIGKPTCSGGKLRLDFIESSPLGTNLDGLIADIVIRAGITYAEAIGATQLRIMNPVNEQVKEHYLSKPGFRFDSHSNFCFRDL
ncbi:MAG: hypothetical protein OQK04_01065 [Kangiellaceae bacterium]|nr:hypothetical protein [Kangiellaceae bacterium]MCW8997291.1 hypothetical protein [Kangiellaceae bacterium]